MQVSAKELGLKSGSTRTEVYAAGERCGLTLCPAELVLSLFLQYPGLLLRGERLFIAMEPIDYDCEDNVFIIESLDNGCWIKARHSLGPVVVYCNEDYWVFVRSK